MGDPIFHDRNNINIVYEICPCCKGSGNRRFQNPAPELKLAVGPPWDRCGRCYGTGKVKSQGFLSGNSVSDSDETEREDHWGWMLENYH